MASDQLKQLQLLEQNRQQFLMQKHQLQLQLTEIESALEHISETAQSYKIIANIMVAADPKKLREELQQKKEVVELRIQSLEKQESKMQQQAESLQKDLLGKDA